MLLAATLFMLIPSMALGALTEEAFEQWYEHMTYLVDGIGARTLGTEADRLARAYLADQFERAGMIREDGTLLESACLVNGVEAVSLIGRMPAVNADARIVTVCAHYDSHTPGARDNASGVAAMLTLMSHFSALAPFPDTELRFIAFAAEEVGQLGSRAYVEGLTQDERQRSLAVFNIDILAVDVWDTETAFSCDTLGMRAEGRYVDGTDDAPAVNGAARAILAAMDEVGGFAAEDEGVSWCVPRHMGMSDHESFHLAGIDAANVCFRGNVAQGGGWPEFMHSPSDVMGDFDLERSRQALEVLITAVEGLAADPGYGA